MEEPEGNSWATRDGIISAEDGTLLRKITPPFGTGVPTWSPDGRELEYLLRRDGAGNLWRQPLDGGPMKQVTHFPSGEVFDYSWSKDGKMLAISRGRFRSDVVRISNFR